jgi:A/G-specific adenine glycosylase
MMKEFSSMEDKSKMPDSVDQIRDPQKDCDRGLEYTSLFDPLVDWYKRGHRDLPWRRTRDPYRIWISEIMLQQTRVEAVIPYYERFLTALPTIRDLAECPEDELMKLWEGLGYYSRARNLKKAAQVIMENYGGKMPADHDAILSLPGIGPYTAGAISSIAFGLPFSAVDGNALRILTRVACDGRNIAEEKTKKAITADLDQDMQEGKWDFGPGDLNQAMMELGATVCLPNGEPQCQACPWREQCLARQRKCIHDYPVKSKPKARRIEERTILLIRDGDRVLLRKRPDKGLLAGLYEFPGLEGHVSEKDALEYARGLGLDPLQVETGEEARHIFSHVEWRMTSYVIRVASVDFDRKTASAITVTGGGINQAVRAGADGQGEIEDRKSESGSPWLLAELDQARSRYAIPSAFKVYTEYLWGGRK